MKLKLYHRDISILPMPPDFVWEYDGQWESKTGIIRITPTLDAADQGLTAIHEVLHAVWEHHRIPAKPDEETAVEGLSRGLALVFRDNPEFLGVLHQALSNGKAIVE